MPSDQGKRLMQNPGMSAAIVDVWTRRAQILEDFCRAYLAENMPAGKGPDWSLKNIEMVEEQRSEGDKILFVWYFRRRDGVGREKEN